jgi:two-component system cell cycle response regulator
MDFTSPVRPDPGAPTRRLPCLVVVRGLEPGKVIPVEAGERVVGRGRAAQIQLEDQGISRAHARLRVQGGRVSVEDLGSTNGVYCNGRKIRCALLRDGDCLQLGDCLLTFRMNHPDEGRLLRLLYHRATRDALTGLFNRASLEDRLGREVERQRRYRRGLAVLQLDLDHFKTINDTHGHAAGDAVLRAVARVVRTALRSCDLAARVGGEELVIVLPEADAARALGTAEKLRRRVEGLAVEYQGRALKVTGSIGVAVAGPEGGGAPVAALLLAAADAACYQAKRAGRNRVCASFQQEPTEVPRSAAGAVASGAQGGRAP